MGDLERCNSSMVGGLWWTVSVDGLEGLWTKLSVEKKRNTDGIYCDQGVGSNSQTASWAYWVLLPAWKCFYLCDLQLSRESNTEMQIVTITQNEISTVKTTSLHHHVMVVPGEAC